MAQVWWSEGCCKELDSSAPSYSNSLAFKIFIDLVATLTFNHISCVAAGTTQCDAVDRAFCGAAVFRWILLL